MPLSIVAKNFATRVENCRHPKKAPPEKQNATFHIWGSLTALRFPLPNLPTIPNFWYSGSFSKVIVQALTIDHPLTRVFVLMCMLHPDKPSNLSGPWVTNVANMITRIYAAITRIYAAIFSGKFRKFLATRMKLKNIISIFVLNAYQSLSGSSEPRKQIMKHWLVVFRNDQPFRS